MKANLKKSLYGYLFIAPNILLFAAFTLIPTIFALIMAFKNFKSGIGIFDSKWVGFDNFREIFMNRDFLVSIVNTCVYTFIFVPLNLVISFIAAAMIYRLSARARSFFKSAFFLPGVISAVVIAIAWKWIFNFDNGLANMLLGIVGIDPVLWFASRWTALATVIISQLAYAPGIGIILYSAAMSRIPEDILEAARIDGAGSMHLFVKIIFPLLKPTTLYIVIITAIESFKIFTPIYIMTEARPANQSTVVVYEIYKQAFENNEYGMASAQALILMLIVIVFSIIQFRFFTSEAEY